MANGEVEAVEPPARGASEGLMMQEEKKTALCRGRGRLSAGLYSVCRRRLAAAATSFQLAKE